MNAFTPSPPSEAGNVLNISDELLIKAFAKLDKTALGVAVGAVFGLGIFGVTIFLIAKGGDPVGPNLGLVGQYFVGYTVTLKGSLIGLAYGFVSGFFLGWFTAFLRNLFVAVFLHTVKLKAVISSLNDFVGDL
jgi:hypothetical protein